MNFQLGRVTFSICLFWLGAWPAHANTNHHVILITIDGGAAFYLQDPQAPLPTLRKLAAQGVMAEGMRVANPSITWPNHTTLVRAFILRNIPCCSTACCCAPVTA